MKKLISLLLIFALLSLCACASGETQAPAASDATPAVKTEVSAPTASAVTLYKDKLTLSENNGAVTLCEVTYPALALSTADAEKYAKLSRALAALNAESAANSQTAFSELLYAAQVDYEKRSAAESESADTGEETAPFETFYRYDDLACPRADSRAVSILYSMTSYSGGVHGNYYYYSTNLDTSTGRSLLVGDVVLDMARLREVLEAALRHGYPDADFSGMEDALNAYFSDPASFTWTLDYEGLTFFFSPGELADFETGKLICSLRFADYQGLFSEYYTLTPTNYAVPFTDGKCLNLDLNADGANDEIAVERVYSKDGAEIEKLIISVNGKDYTANTPMLECTPYLVNIASARYYLIVSAQNLTGYGYLGVYKLDRSGASLVGMVYDTSLYAAAYADECPGEPLLTNPDSFPLGTRQQYLGTLTGLKTYSVGADGMPVTADSYYTLSGAAPLTLKSQLVTATIDASGSGTFAAVTLAPGTVMSFLRSDGAGAVDMVTDDEVYCRLYVSGKLGAQYVNGMAAESLFDGIGK